MKESCTQCRSEFEITSDDLAFYDKISPIFGGKKYPIPPPTLCPDCRLKRRMAWRNVRRYHRRQCSLCKKNVISMFAAETAFPVYCRDCWWGDAWDGFDCAQSPDFTRPFFDQFSQLLKNVPRLYFVNANSENSDYCNHVEGMKNCYMVTGSVYSEDCLYGERNFHCRNCVDCLWCGQCELCYECIDCTDCYNAREARQCRDVRDSAFVSHCFGSSNLLFCVNLHRGEWRILNKQLTKEEFMKEKERILNDLKLLDRHRAEYEQLRLQHPVPHMEGVEHQECTGNYINASTRARETFDVSEVEDVKYLVDTVKLKDSMDCFSYYGPGELCYEIHSGGLGTFRCMFCCDAWPANDVMYCESCFGCASCFGCIGLKHKKFCILNKQYTKEEYEELVPKLIEHMQSTKEFGEYLPIAISPWPYNESTAQEYFPMTKKNVLSRGWRWLDADDELPKVSKVIRAAELPASAESAPDDILNWAVECEATGRPFKIIKQELDFYRTHHLPLPRLHPDERHKRRTALRNPRKLWNRECAKCKKEIQTAYPPERPAVRGSEEPSGSRGEIVWCEECYREIMY